MIVLNESRTIRQWFIDNTRNRIQRYKDIRGPKVVQDNMQKEVDTLEAGGKIDIGGDFGLVDTTFDTFQVKRGSGGKQYIEFDNGVNYFPEARYGRFITLADGATDPRTRPVDPEPAVIDVPQKALDAISHRYGVAADDFEVVDYKQADNYHHLTIDFGDDEIVTAAVRETAGAWRVTIEG